MASTLSTLRTPLRGPSLPGKLYIIYVGNIILIRFSISNIFVIGEGTKSWVSLPKGKGLKLTIAEERDVRRRRATES